MTPRDRRTLAAVAACAGSLLLSGIAVFWPIAAPARLPPIVPPPVGGSAASDPVGPIDAYRTIVATPLFLSDRRMPSPPKPHPHPAAREVPAAPPPLLGDPVLLGVAISPDRPLAVLRGRNGTTVTVAEGGTFNGWTLDRVLPDHVEFRLGAAVEKLAFPVPTPGPALQPSFPPRRPFRPPPPAPQTARRPPR